jgi:hypothetical protein
MPTVLQNPFNVYHIPQMQNPMAIPIIKNYNINAIGPSMNHVKIYNIMEDVLPANIYNLSFSTINDRQYIEGYVKNTFFNLGNGMNVSLDDKADSLLSYLKFLDLNPFNTNKYSNNPYSGLPKGMILFRSCYPIKHDKKINSTTCAKNSIGMNIKIFGLTQNDYDCIQNCIQINSDLNKNKNDIWREIEYYNLINSEVIKKFNCPNFIISYGYYLSEQCSINFDKLNSLSQHTNNSDVFLKKKQKNQNYINKALVLLTESPNFNLLQWSSKSYARNGNIQTMINTGYYNEHVWKSIYFQLFMIFHVFQILKIYFVNYNIEDNIFIKIVKNDSNVTSYWKYVIDDIEYYIPNYGFIVVFDSSFKNIPSTLTNKIESEHFKDERAADYYFQKNYEIFKLTTDPNIYNSIYYQNGGNAPPKNISDMLHEIQNKKKQNISYYILNHMTEFLNNRIGTLLNKDEVDKIDKNNKNFKKGQIIVYEESYNVYKFALLYKIKNQSFYVLLSNKNFTKNKITNNDSLYKYAGTIIQNYDIEKSLLNDNSILETYHCTS